MSDAFWGAGFATLFSLFAYALTSSLRSIYNRKNRHHDGLVKLEHKLNADASRMYDAIHDIAGLIKAHEAGALATNNIGVNKLSLINDYTSFLDIELINAIFDYDYGIDRLNKDIQNMANMYTEMRSSVIAKQISIPEFRGSMPNLTNDLSRIINGYERQIEQAIEIQAQVRLMIKRDRTLLIKIKYKLVTIRRKPLPHNAVKAEVAKLKREINDSGSG